MVITQFAHFAKGSFITKYRQKSIYEKLRKKIGGIIRDLFRQKGIELHEGNAMANHIHLLLSIPPKFSVAFNGSSSKPRPLGVGW